MRVWGGELWKGLLVRDEMGKDGMGRDEWGTLGFGSLALVVCCYVGKMTHGSGWDGCSRRGTPKALARESISLHLLP